MSWWSFLLPTGGIGEAADKISGAVARFTGDKVQREGNAHDEAMAVYQAYSSENLQVRENRTRWDSFVDGLNRLPRPLMALGVFGLFVWPIFDEVQFAKAMTAYALIPEWLAYVFLAIVGFYFTTRSLEKIKIGGGPTPQQVASVLETQKQIAALKVKPMDVDRYQAEMIDFSKPLSNPAIEEWNRRRGN